MSEHYYSKTPQSKSDQRNFTFQLRNHSFIFTTDHGVFSKNEVDYGSRVLIDAYQPPEIDGINVDLGCGYGPIGLSLAKAFPDQAFLLVDVNERALELAEINRNQNHITNATVMQSDRLQDVHQQPIASIITNPPIRAGKETVHLMLEESFEKLTSGGQLWVVIQKKQGAPSAKKKMEEFFGEVDTVVKDKGYFVLVAKKFD
ncbi:class I SAM-dependent methyltransferase [Bacillaceae bacterium S4-13-58]